MAVDANSQPTNFISDKKNKNLHKDVIIVDSVQSGDLLLGCVFERSKTEAILYGSDVRYNFISKNAVAVYLHDHGKHFQKVPNKINISWLVRPDALISDFSCGIIIDASRVDAVVVIIENILFTISMDTSRQFKNSFRGFIVLRC